ncbi:MAG TPA: sulfatase-like hydrolase/transferase [Draconibacterium sp.]|nr:sulfatase-like hydrolase/transferase [Draconibacterium sp.]
MKKYLTLIIFLLFVHTTFSGEKSQKPNIIFFIADDMYPEMFNCLPEGKGKNLSPNLDRLASEGVIMENQYVVSPVCTPSRYNCLTGNYASRSTSKQFLNKTSHEEGQTVIQWNSFITDGDKILPHYLKELGYTTGMVGKNHVIEANGLQQFTDFRANANEPDVKRKITENYQKVQQAILKNGFDYADGLYHNNPDFIGVEELAVQNMDWIAEAGLKFIEQTNDKPFFLYFATTIPHGPSNAERSWEANPKITAKGYLDEAPGVLPARNTLSKRLKEAGINERGKENVLWLDDALGALLNKLEEKGILDNTIIFFFNDHGQHAKGTLYQGGIFNPSIIWKSGGFECGNKSKAKIMNVDFAPTILEIAGGKNLKDEFDGFSFKSVLDGKGFESRESLFFELGYARAVIKGDYKYYAVRYPNYAKNWTAEQRDSVLSAYNRNREFRNMAVVNRDPSKPFSHLEVVPGGGQAENESYGKLPGYFDADQLYNLTKDPGEKQNLSGNSKHQKILLEMKKELQNYLDDLPGKFDL